MNEERRKHRKGTYLPYYFVAGLVCLLIGLAAAQFLFPPDAELEGGGPACPITPEESEACGIPEEVPNP